MSGVDPDAPSASGSATGASWVIPLSSLDRPGAFLAVRMNGEPLPLDHGRPVRLVVPGWYGCAWIKWVDEIRLVGSSEPATSQMKEFAGRTHQSARHDLARDFVPPEIQTAALPIRVERRKTASGIEYRIVGIVWGGEKPVDRLAIRFGATDPGRRSPSVPRLPRLPPGRSGISDGSRRHRARTRSSCASPIPPFLSGGSIPATTCAKSRSDP